MAVAAVILLAACGASPSVSTTSIPIGGSTPAPSSEVPMLRYVALGDSFTIGTSVGAAERWPEQLVARLAARPSARTLELAANLGVNGYTTRNVIDRELPALDGLAPGFASLMIGVNDVVQGAVETKVASNIDTILDGLLARLPAGRIVCIDTPDYTVTPQGRLGVYGDPDGQRRAIARVNARLRTACEARSIRFVDGIFAISEDAATDPSLVADDGLHPSGAQYRRWVEERIEPAVRELLDAP